MTKKYGRMPNPLEILVALLGAGLIALVAILASQYVHQ